MIALFMSIGIVFLLLAFSTTLVALTTQLFPSSRRFIPSDWQRWLSLNYVAYYWLIGGFCVLVGQQFS
ncbi:MAG TPA: hypothetical protein ENK78_06830 [Thiothrix sp.]|nr:hypothetical protein [Thiothrix sp.]